MISLQSRCQVCQRTCRPLRCTRCHNAFYCSTKCQRIDWKSGGHKKSCSPKSMVVVRKKNGSHVDAALKELHSLAQDLSIDQLQEEYHKAHDEVKRQHQAQKEMGSAVPTPTAKASMSTTMKSPAEKHGNSTCKQGPEMTRLLDQAGAKIAPENFCYEVFVEEMPRLSRYQINLKPRQGSISQIAPQSLELSVRPLGKSRSLVSIFSSRDDFLNISFELPNLVVQSSIPQESADKDGTIQFRVEYESKDWDDNKSRIFDASGSRHRSPSLVNSMKCRFCGLSLLPPSTIERVVPLPTGYWDEISDYLICYSGVSRKELCYANPNFIFIFSNLSFCPSIQYFQYVATCSRLHLFWRTCTKQRGNARFECGVFAQRRRRTLSMYSSSQWLRGRT